MDVAVYGGAMKTTLPNQTIQKQTNAYSHQCLARISRLLALLLVTALLGGATSAKASDPIGLFARVDKVTFEPSEEKPERVVIEGSFALADTKKSNRYLEPQQGVLFFKLPSEKPQVAINEWRDLKSVAGTSQLVGFGSRHKSLPTVRKEKSTQPEEYPIGFGVVKVTGHRAEYPAIRALQKEKAESAVSTSAR
jgi:hypothetical protein